MKWYVYFSVFTCLLCLHIGAAAQKNSPLIDSIASQVEAFAARAGETSVYIRCNKDVYIAGEDLWFNALVLNARELNLSDLDKILYLQLTRRDGDSVVWKEMYPVANGLASGHVYLPDTLAAGNYLLKAYTAHSFYGRPGFYAAAPVQVVKEPRSIKRFARLGDAAGAPVKLAFFPEGGTLVAGIPNVVAFKAVNKDGLPAVVNGVLLKNGQALFPVTSVHAGLGSFTFTPEAGAVYTVKADSSFHLPKVSPEGIVMRLLGTDKDSIAFLLTSRPANRQAIFLRIQVRGMLQAIVAGVLTDSAIIKAPIAAMPRGIAEVTLFNGQLRPMAERLVFLHPQRKLNVTFTQVKEQYAPKEEVNIKVRTTDENGEPVPAAISVRVIDRLFADNRQVSDIDNYYHLTTQLGGQLYDPSGYTDQRHMDLLLMTACYNWRDATAGKPVLADSLYGVLSPAFKSRKETAPVSLMLFNYSKSTTQVAVANSKGIFAITPDNLANGRRFFIRYFSEKEYKINVPDMFDTIGSVERQHRPIYIPAEKTIVQEEEPPAPGLMQYGRMLQGIAVQSKGRSFGDKYLGYLDSIARFEGNTDFVGACGWLNCPACGSGTKPVEGVTYSELKESKRSQVAGHPFSFTQDDYRKVTYHYPTYTEEELLKKFKMIMTRGFYMNRTFETPDYTKEDKTTPDNRNTLYWAPVLVTDANGEAVIRFFSSDILGRFVGTAEGIGENGELGKGVFEFSVRGEN